MNAGNRKFFPLMALCMVIIVAIAFSPTLYLRPLGSADLPVSLQRLPLHIYVHGIALTVWFLLWFAQTLLVATGRVGAHRTVGLIAAFAAIAVVTTSLISTQQVIDHPVRLPLRENPAVFFGNVLSVLQFAVFVACGVLLRSRRQAHGRLMYLANVPLLASAVSRLPFAAHLPIVAVVNIPLLFLLALIAHDLCQARRLHPATLWGGVVGIIVPRLIFIPMGMSPIGRWVVDTLS